MHRIVTRPWHDPRRRTRDIKIVGRYHEIRADLPCEWCRLAVGTELNHVLHGQKKEDAPWNFQLLCHRCHQDSVVGFHGSRPAFTIADALRKKLREGFLLPREAWAYLEGVDHWPGTEQTIDEQLALAERLAEIVRRR